MKTFPIFVKASGAFKADEKGFTPQQLNNDFEIEVIDGTLKVSSELLKLSFETKNFESISAMTVHLSDKQPHINLHYADQAAYEGYCCTNTSCGTVCGNNVCQTCHGATVCC